MLKYVFILMMLLPAHTFAGPTESTLQYILDDYQAECVAAQEESMEVVPEGANLSAVRIKLRDDSIYEIDITADGKKATVLYADPWCPQPDVFIVLGPENTLGGAVAQALINCGWRGWKNKSGFRSSNEEKPRLISLGLSE